VEVTSRCERDCVYCYNVWKADPAYPRGELSSAELVSLVDRAVRESGIPSIQITGGEPLLRADLIDIVEGIRAPGRRVSLVTDGGAIDDGMAAELRRLRVGPVQPTLLAANAEIHDGLKGATCFEDTVAGIARLKRAGVPVSVSFVCTRKNHGHFEEVVELCFALGIEVVAFSRFCAAGKGGLHREELTPTGEMIARCLDVAEQANASLGMKVSVAISLPLCAVDISRYPHLSFGRCAVSGRTPGFTIDPSGNLRACSISGTVLGNLREESWNEILERAGRAYFEEMAEAPTACRECPLLDRCGGGCRESALTCTGSLGRPDPLARIPVCPPRDPSPR
jgi:radical SAM protein with 4Fe4S-binding SPASM domain